MTQFLFTQQVIDLHDEIIQEFGGRTGLLNLGLLYSAVEMPKSSIDRKFLHPTLFDQAAAYLFHIYRNLPFLDGNKRTAIASTLLFLEKNGVVPLFEEAEIEEIVVDTAQGKVSKRLLSDYFFRSQAFKS